MGVEEACRCRTHMLAPSGRAPVAPPSAEAEPGPPIDHDSLHLYNAARQFSRVPTANAADTTAAHLTALATLRTRLDSLRANRPTRLDSIRNGADDDGSGSMALLEVAEAVAAAATKPRRSLVFVWHTAEEKGLLGARHFTENPTVPRE